MNAQKTILVFGATGQTGQHFVALALEGGHRVRALARDPAKLTITHPDLEVRRGSVPDFADLDSLVQGADYVVSMLGEKEVQRHHRVNTTFVAQLRRRCGGTASAVSSTRPVVSANPRTVRCLRFSGS